MSPLEQILENKRAEIKALPKSLSRNLCLPAAVRLPRGTFAFSKALARQRPGLIAEFKRRSPSQGAIREEADLPATLSAYASCAHTLSVLCDQAFFGARPTDLEQAATASSLPILAKDFILAKAQIDHFRFRGAQAVLLIVGILGKRHLAELHAHARESGLDALVETHTEAELSLALDVGVPLIGINNRDLRTFEVDLSTTPRLLDSVKASDLRGKIIVSESGHRTLDDFERTFADPRVHAVLAGTALMKNHKLCFAFRKRFGGRP